ncbi:insulin-degrading enzyme [Moniliophthora roreri]|nr:insulin-degrading enzyme [Moniliophthora roreri]
MLGRTKTYRLEGYLGQTWWEYVFSSASVATTLQVYDASAREGSHQFGIAPDTTDRDAGRRIEVDESGGGVKMLAMTLNRMLQSPKAVSDEPVLYLMADNDRPRIGQ